MTRRDYSADSGELIDRTGKYVDRILRGAKAADLPVELPSTYRLTIDSRTARAIAYPVPESQLLRADKIID